MDVTYCCDRLSYTETGLCAAMLLVVNCYYPDIKVQGAIMVLFWGRQDPDGPHVGPMNLATRVGRQHVFFVCLKLARLHSFHFVLSPVLQHVCTI